MNRDGMREIGLGIIVVLMAIAGTLIDATGGDTSPRESRAPTDLYFERSVFCAPVPSALTDGGEVIADATAHHTIAGTLADETVLVGRESADDDPKELTGNLLDTSTDRSAPSVFTGLGDFVQGTTATSFRGPEAGLAGAACAPVASDEWYFPYGSSARGFNEWILLYNPFPDEAVVRMTLVTPGGTRSPSGLTDVAVPARQFMGLRLNDYQLQQKALGVEVEAVRGRVVSWQVIYAQASAGHPSGVSMSLGAPAPAVDWYFPAGAIGNAQDQRIAILNPGPDEALVTVSLITDEEGRQPPDLVEMPIPAGTSREIDLRKEVQGEDLGGASVAVRSVNEVPIAVEQALWYSEEDFRGFTTELGAPRGAKNWWVGPVAAKPERDALLLMNTSEDEATVNITLVMVDGPPLTPADLSGITIPPGGRVRVGLEEITARGLAVALVGSTSDIAVERIAYSRAANDVSTVMGIPLD